LPEQLAGNWHHWRGPGATRVSATAKPPTKWSEEKNIQWKVAIDGCGSAALSRLFTLVNLLFMRCRTSNCESFSRPFASVSRLSSRRRFVNWYGLGIGGARLPLSVYNIAIYAYAQGM